MLLFLSRPPPGGCGGFDADAGLKSYHPFYGQFLNGESHEVCECVREYEGCLKSYQRVSAAHQKGMPDQTMVPVCPISLIFLHKAPFVECLLQKCGQTDGWMDRRTDERTNRLVVKHLNEQQFWSLIKNIAFDRFRYLNMIPKSNTAHIVR